MAETEGVCIGKHTGRADDPYLIVSLISLISLIYLRRGSRVSSDTDSRTDKLRLVKVSLKCPRVCAYFERLALIVAEIYQQTAFRLPTQFGHHGWAPSVVCSSPTRRTESMLATLLLALAAGTAQVRVTGLAPSSERSPNRALRACMHRGTR